MNPQMKQAIAKVVAETMGWCGLEKAEHLALLTLDAHPDLIVEIGVFGGKSLIPLALAAKQYGGKVVGIDPWMAGAALEGTNGEDNDKWWASLDYERVFSTCINDIQRFGVSENVTIMRCMDVDAIRTFLPESIGILHVDGNHSPEVSRRYIEQWGPLVKKGGYLIMDDTDWPSQAETVKLIESRFTLINSFPSWAVYRKESNGNQSDHQG